MKNLFGEEAVVTVGRQEIRALSWKQPYASLMLHGKIETRTWSTPYRGLVLICASKVSYKESDLIGIAGSRGAQSILVKLHSEQIKEPVGMAIAVGRLVDCRKMKPSDTDRTFTSFNGNLWCHVYEDVRAIEPFDWKGSQGWKKLDEETIKRIKYL